MTKNTVVYGVAFVVFCYALYSLFRIITSFAPDFSVFYGAAGGFLAHKNIYTIPMYTGFGYPPFTLLPFLLFTLLPYQVAQGIWIVISFLLLFYCIYLSLKKSTLLLFCVVFILTFLAFPTKFTLGMGQVNFLALALLLLAVRHKSGVALGMLFVVKPHFLLLLPLYVLAGEWSMVLIAGFIVLAGVLSTNLSLYVYYFRVVVPPLLLFVGRGIYYNQGLGSFFSRTLPLSLARDLTTWVSLLLVIVGLWFVWNKRMSLYNSLMLFLPILLLIEPLSWQHHYVFLLPVYVWLFTKIKNQPALLTLMWLSYGLVSINFRVPTAVLLSHVFFGNVLLLSLVVYESA